MKKSRFTETQILSVLVCHYTRECLAIEVDISLPASRVVRSLEWLKEHETTSQIRVDNGPKIIAAEFYDWYEYRLLISNLASHKRMAL